MIKNFYYKMIELSQFKTLEIQFYLCQMYFDGLELSIQILKDKTYFQFYLDLYILKLNLDDKIKERVIARLKNVDSDKHKHLEWFELLLKIPFKKFSNIPVSKEDGEEKLSNYFDSVYETLDKATYGMQQVKEEIVNFVAQIVSTNNTNMPRIIALQGEAGCGKSALIRRFQTQRELD